jgi:hypothetical protein
MSNTKAVSPYQAMATDVAVSMDDVVSAFVAQYETNLYDRKKDLQSKIQLTKQHIDIVKKDVLAAVDAQSFVRDLTLPFGLTATVNGGDIDFDKEKVAFVITIKNDTGRSSYGNTINIHRNKKIPVALMRQHKGYVKELKELEAQLNETLMSLKQLPRKERQVRGKVAMRKLEESGYASLMEDQELALLVQLDD